MRILAVADEESKGLWDYFRPEKLLGIDLIVGCGDLDANYLSFLATMAHVPVIYVHGNHDESYDRKPPEGTICIDDQVYTYQGVRFVGLGGSCRYRAGAWQFTEAEMKKRIRHLRGRIDRMGGFDVLVTHTTVHGYGDMSDPAHRGFTVFRELLDAYRPPLMLHGHIHLSYGANIPREHIYNTTRIVNTFQRYVVELDLPQRRPEPANLWQRLFHHRPVGD
ncbi:metallophosphoesterase family protein [uncultured Gemmiger sp.]|uniref:metallophosphoesterase family protein n=1 Tax=uncultured Gemmiger sp. TaxID=1623490 RepID=UPI0025F7F72D|nr:metallophosphoesterase family protein [uncultured Gemmiger sp.]